MAREITRKYIMKHRTNKGAWTKSQIEALGLPWPNEKGWVARVIGTTITNEAAEVFESRKPAKQVKKPISELTCDEMGLVSSAIYRIGINQLEIIVRLANRRIKKLTKELDNV